MKRIVVLALSVSAAVATETALTEFGVPRRVAIGGCFLPPVTMVRSRAPVAIDFALSGIDSFPSPDTTPFGLAYDGSNLWNVDLMSGRIFALDPVNGSVRRSFRAPDQWSKGLCFDGQCLWVTGNYDSRIYKVDTASGSVVQTFAAPGSNPVGLAWDGANLWCADVNSNQARPSQIFKLDPGSGVEVDSFEAPCRMVADMEWDGTRLWVNDMENGVAYGLDPATGAVLKATGTPGPMPTGLCFVHGHIAIADWSRKLVYLFQPDSGPAAIILDRPAQWDVLPTWCDPVIIGTVAGLGLDSFLLEYGASENPTQWEPVGPVQTAPEYKDTLAVWDLSGITTAGAYVLRVRAFFGGRIDTARAAVVGIDPQIASGWPRSLPNVSPVTCADIAGSPDFEVIAGIEHQDFLNNKLAAWCYDGDAVPGFPVSGVGLCQMPAATGDVNRDWRNEIGTGFDLNRNQVFLVRGNGSVVAGWPQDGGRPGSLQYHGIPVFVLTDSEMPVGHHVFSGGGLLSGWDSAGNALPGWPVSGEFSSPALADFDSDGRTEFVSLRADSVYVFKTDGQVVSGWPVAVGGTGGATFPVVGDINSDERLEIVFTIGTKLCAVDDSGAMLAGFPKYLSGSYANSPVLGDLDGDGDAEIVVVSGSFPSYSTVAVLRPDGSTLPGWPKTLNGQVFRSFNAPIIGDVSGDAHPDVVMGFENATDGFEKLHAWDHEGNEVPGFPKLLRYIYGYGITGSAVLTDMNQDDQLEMAISSNAYWMYNTDIYVWNLGVPHNMSRLPWPMFRHDPQMTASYIRPSVGVSSQHPAVEHARPAATVVQRVLARTSAEPAVLVDAGGRKVMDLRRGPNDVAGVPPGVYFIIPSAGTRPARLVVVR